MSESHLSELEFSGLDLPEPLRLGIADAGFTHATPIQAQTLPQALEGKDVAYIESWADRKMRGKGEGKPIVILPPEIVAYKAAIDTTLSDG